MTGWWNNTPKTLAEKRYFQKAQTSRNSLRYMRLFYKTIFKPGRSSHFIIKRSVLYTCQFVFPPSMGFPKGRACIDDVYGSPDPDCPACNGTGYPVNADQYREVKVMGLFVPLSPEERAAEIFGKTTTETNKLIVGLPVPPEYTEQFGLKPKTDVLDKEGNIVETNVFIGYKLEIDDVVVKIEDYWDGQVQKKIETEYIVTKIIFNQLSIGYFKLIQVAAVQLKNTGDHVPPQGQNNQ